MAHSCEGVRRRRGQRTTAMPRQFLAAYTRCRRRRRARRKVAGRGQHADLTLVVEPPAAPAANFCSACRSRRAVSPTCCTGPPAPPRRPTRSCASRFATRPWSHRTRPAGASAANATGCGYSPPRTRRSTRSCRTFSFAHRIAWNPSEILRLLQLNLFERRPLLELLGSGNESPPDRSSQLTMKFAWS